MSEQRKSLWKSKSRWCRGRLLERSRGAGPVSGSVGLFVIVLALLPLAISGSYYMHVLILAFIYVVVSSGFRTISISGQFNIAQGAFMGIGAYAAAIPSVWLGWPPYVTIPLGAVAATILGAAIAYPFARLRTVYYAMGTLFLGYVVMNLITAGGKTTGMSTGLGGVEPLFESRTSYYYMGLVLMLVSLVCMYRFEFSRIGIKMKAVAQSHQVAASVGIGERRNRIHGRGVQQPSSRVFWAPSTFTTRESPHRAATVWGPHSGSSCTSSSEGSTASGVRQWAWGCC